MSVFNHLYEPSAVLQIQTIFIIQAPTTYQEDSAIALNMPKHQLKPIWHGDRAMAPTIAMKTIKVLDTILSYERCYLQAKVNAKLTQHVKTLELAAQCRNLYMCTLRLKPSRPFPQPWLQASPQLKAF